MFFKRLLRPLAKTKALPLPPAPHRSSSPRAITIPETPRSRRKQEQDSNRESGYFGLEQKKESVK